MYNVIADVAGRYNTLMALLKKMPEGIPLSVGDMVDRGDASKKVLDFFMENGEALLGNHEHMMWDYFEHERADRMREVYMSPYSRKDWLYNGGDSTLESFGGEVPEKYLRFIESLPIQKLVTVNNKKILISHAFTPAGTDIKTLPYTETIASLVHKNERTPFNMIWNRRPPVKLEGIDYQICGHNSQFGSRSWTDENGDQYASCIDASASDVLVGIHLPTMTIYTQEYLEDNIDIEDTK